MSRKLIRPASLPSARRNAPYFTLLARVDGSWSEIVFGDYSRAVVLQELEDTLDSGGNEYRRRDLRIVRTVSAAQAEIDAAMASLNGVPAPVPVAEPAPADIKTAGMVRTPAQAAEIIKRENEFATNVTVLNRLYGNCCDCASWSGYFGGSIAFGQGAMPRDVWAAVSATQALLAVVEIR